MTMWSTNTYVFLTTVVASIGAVLNGVTFGYIKKRFKSDSIRVHIVLIDSCSAFIFLSIFSLANIFINFNWSCEFWAFGMVEAILLFPVTTLLTSLSRFLKVKYPILFFGDNSNGFKKVATCCVVACVAYAAAHLNLVPNEITALCEENKNTTNTTSSKEHNLPLVVSSQVNMFVGANI